MRRRLVYVPLLLACVCVLAGCGQKGPLVRPPPRHVAAKPAPAATAASSASVASPATVGRG